MALLDNGLSLFGVEIISKKQSGNNSASLALPIDDEGSAVVTSPNSAYYGVYMDTEGQVKNDAQFIEKYREISLFPEVDIAIQDIINEAIPQENDSPQLDILLDRLDASDEFKNQIIEEFDNILRMLRYSELSADLFRRWYVDGRLFFQIVVDKTDPSLGIRQINLIDALKIRKVREIKKKKTPTGVEVIDTVDEYFIYNDAGFTPQQSTSSYSGNNAQGVKIAPDSIVYVPSGFNDQQTGSVLSYLHKALRPANQLRMLEDATIIYQLARAPERRIFYLDVGTLPKQKAEEYMQSMMNKYRNKMVYDAKTGDIRDDKKYMSMLEDFWLPRRDGSKGTQIETLPGSQNIDGQLANVNYFKEKLYESLNIPASRFQQETGFSLGRSSEISRDELKFQKFIERLRLKYSQLFYDLLKTQLVLKGIVNTEEWDEFLKEKIYFRFQKDNYFSELKALDMLQSKMALMPQIDPYLGKYFSKIWVQRNILKLSDQEIEQMNEEIVQEIGDPTAQPTFAGGMGLSPDATTDDAAMAQGSDDDHTPQNKE